VRFVVSWSTTSYFHVVKLFFFVVHISFAINQTFAYCARRPQSSNPQECQLLPQSQIVPPLGGPANFVAYSVSRSGVPHKDQFLRALLYRVLLAKDFFSRVIVKGFTALSQLSLGGFRLIPSSFFRQFRYVYMGHPRIMSCVSQDLLPRPLFETDDVIFPCRNFTPPLFFLGYVPPVLIMSQ